MAFRIKSTTYNSDDFPLIVGILNLTPDSFYDGGKYTENDKILCVNPSSSEYVIYEAKLEKSDNYKRMKMFVEYLYTEKKYLIYQIK